MSDGATRGGAQVPFMFKYAVDALTADPSGAAPLGAAMALTPAALIAGYGVARAGSAMCNELRNATFAKARGSCHAPSCAMPATAVPIIPSHRTATAAIARAGGLQASLVPLAPRDAQ